MSMRRCNILIAITSILFGLVIFYLGRNLGGFDAFGVPGENYWPYIIASLLVLLGLIQFLETALNSDASESVDLQSRSVRMAFLSAIVSLLYGGLILLTGFIAATFVFIPAMMLLMGERTWWKALFVSGAVVVTIYVFFIIVFNTTLPPSILFD